MRAPARVAALASILAFAGCSRSAPDPLAHGSAAVQLKPLTTPLAAPTVQNTVYVPVYSSIYLGLDLDRNMVRLAATVSVRNVSSRERLVLDHVRYYDSGGRMVRDYVSRPAELGPLASVEFVIQQHDDAGGPGANFLVQWTGPEGIDEPLIEAVMLGQSGTVGYSFTSAGRKVKNEPLP